MQNLLLQSDTLSKRISDLHTRLIETVPAVDRIACALYDAKQDLLKTFINSTRSGEPITRYEYRLSDSQSLLQLAKTGSFRVLDDINSDITSNNEHSTWLRAQGYQSSFTVPIYDNGELLGFVFFDSRQSGAFTSATQRDLVLYTTLISMTIAGEMAAIGTILESARVARELTEMRDFETGAHLERMGRYARLIAKEVAAKLDLPDEFVEQVHLYAPLHDIGKIGIPDRILLKPGKLTPEERHIMNSHVEKGVEINDRIMGAANSNRLPDASILRNIVQNHHELLDGTGYPRGLKGDQIPIEARIVSVADVFDALTSMRPYKQRWSVEEAFAELDTLRVQGKLDPDCVAALIGAEPYVRTVMATCED